MSAAAPGDEGEAQAGARWDTAAEAPGGRVFRIGVEIGGNATGCVLIGAELMGLRTAGGASAGGASAGAVSEAGAPRVQAGLPPGTGAPGVPAGLPARLDGDPVGAALAGPPAGDCGPARAWLSAVGAALPGLVTQPGGGTIDG